MQGVLYRVVATLPSREMADKYIEWLLRGGHLREVLRGGAQTGHVIELDPVEGQAVDSVRVESLYTFEDREAFEIYEREVAPRLREEGLRMFPAELGVAFERQAGRIVS